MQLDFNAATASFSEDALSIPDARDVASSLTGGPTVPATVSFQVRWSGVRKRLWMRDEENGFMGNFIENFATLQWSAQQDGFQFISDPASTSKTVFSVIGRESNGAFLYR